MEQQKVKRVHACVFHRFVVLCKPAKIFFFSFFTCCLSCLVTVEALDHSGGGRLASDSAVVLLNLRPGSRFPSDPFHGGVQQESLSASGAADRDPAGVSRRGGAHLYPVLRGVAALRRLLQR